MAEKVGITEINMSNIKTNKIKAIRFSTLGAICHYLQCQPADILEYIDDIDDGDTVGFADGEKKPN